MICDATMDLGYEDNIFYLLGGNVDNCVSLGYCRGYYPSIDPYSLYLKDFPKKVMQTIL